MTVLEVVFQSPLEVTGKANIVELAPTIERIHALAISYVVTDDYLVLFQHQSAQILKVLADQWRACCHNVANFRDI